MHPNRAAFHDVVNRKHMPGLDGLRMIAVGMVVFGHHGYPFKWMPADIGVSAFFVLSGFLITRLLMREEESTGTVSLKNFYARRTLRIFPAYYAFLAVSFVLDRIQGDVWPGALLASGLTYTVNYYNAFNNHPSSSISHAWSLGVEEQFYLLWPFVMMLLARRGRNAVIKGVSTAALLAVVWRTFLYLQGSGSAYIYNAFDTRFDNLAVGCVLALIADHSKVAGAARAAASQAWFPVITIALLMISRLAMPLTYHYTLGMTIDAVLVAIFIAQIMQLYRSPLWSWLENPAVRYLGRISYPMYLYHQWGDAVGRHAAGREPYTLLVGLVAMVLLATGSYYVIEKPFLRLRRFFEADRGSELPGDKDRLARAPA
jgi:peptidoglycan/LPS O-acetylase OafA/YrhL